MITCPWCKNVNPPAERCAVCYRHLPGANVRGYFVQGVLGGGGFSTVYLAAPGDAPARLCALKEVRLFEKDSMEAAAARDSFFKDVRYLSTLDHPQIPKLYDYFEHEGRLYLVMECIAGKDLESYVNENFAVAETQAVDWLGQLCGILSYLHEQPRPIIHRDIKPANLILCERPDGVERITLIDFGNARYYRGNAPGDTTLIGTRLFIPPEMRSDPQRETDARSDIYMAGATLFYLLANNGSRQERYFLEVDPQETGQISGGESMLLEEARQRGLLAASAHIVAVIAKATAYRQDDRFMSARALQAALNDALRQDSVFVQKEMATPIPQRFAKIAADAVPLARTPSPIPPRFFENRRTRSNASRGATRRPMPAPGASAQTLTVVLLMAAGIALFASGTSVAVALGIGTLLAAFYFVFRDRNAGWQRRQRPVMPGHMTAPAPLRAPYIRAVARPHSPTRPPYQVIVVGPGKQPATYRMTKAMIFVGRGPGNDVPLADGKASRRHLEVRYDGTNFTISDLGSVNGTKVNGRRVSTTAAVQIGDRIRIGDTYVYLARRT